VELSVAIPATLALGLAALALMFSFLDACDKV